MEQDDFLLLQANDEIEGDFDLRDLQTELEHLETDEELRADEDEIQIIADQEELEKDQLLYKADNAYLHPKISLPLVKLLFKKDFESIQRVYHMRLPVNPDLWEKSVGFLIQCTYSSEFVMQEHTRQLAVCLY
jgi:hypothetical protein